MTRAERRLANLKDQLEQIETLTAAGVTLYMPELDSAMAQLRDEIEEVEEQMGRRSC